MKRIGKKAEPSSNIEWKQWAKADPLFGVSTLPGREKTGFNPWTDQDFYAYGELIWSEYYPRWQQYGVTTESCLEIGCGAGRITRQLVRYFRAVSAIDISPDMIELTRRSVANAHLMVTDGQSVPYPNNSFTAAFSCEVFQHFDSRDMATTYFGEIFRVLRPDGTMMIQIPIAILPFRRVWPLMGDFQAFLWRVTDRWQKLKSDAKRWLILNRNRRPFYRLLQYDSDWLLARLSEIGFRDVQICVFPVTGNPGEKVMAVHLFARKPSAR